MSEILILDYPAWNSDTIQIDKTRQAIENRGHKMVTASHQDLSLKLCSHCSSTCSGCLSKYAGVITRLGNSSTDEDLIILSALELYGIPIVNGYKCVSRCRSKGLMLTSMAKAGVTIPKTAIISTINPTLKFDAPMVIKSMRGSRGDGVVLCESQDHLDQLIGFARRYRIDQLVVQEVIHGCYGIDWRVIVLGGEFIGAIERKAAGFRSNVGAGGTARMIEIPNEAKELAIKAAASCFLDFAGVDILPGTNGLYVCEVNGAPGFTGFQNATGIDVAQLLVDYLLRKIESPQNYPVPI